MAKINRRYVCQSCGAISPKWLGKCNDCGTFNSYLEEILQTETKSRRRLAKTETRTKIVSLHNVILDGEERVHTGMNEFDRVLGGGLVKGSVVLLGGDPGIGKSTLMMQIISRLPKNGSTHLYVSGEESAKQIRIRAERLKLNFDQLYVLAETSLEDIISAIDETSPSTVVIDSIQTIYHSGFESAPGSVSQIRECASQLMRVAKTKQISIFLVGHVTKEGAIAGPRVLEHIVDTVLYFDGDKHHFYRILHAVKNRFGSTNEIGLFEMQEFGLAEISNPSEIFLQQRDETVTGSAVVCTLEGTRPLLVEIQALVTRTSYGLPQRNTTGFDPRRLSMLLAVLEKRCGVSIGSFDVFVNVAGGVKLVEPSVDMGVLMAVASSLQDRPVKKGSILIGEIGLGGEIRAVNQIDKRIQEAEKLGFHQAFISKMNMKGVGKFHKIHINYISNVTDGLEKILD
jgi:DNA repair protein RadA/Sms